MAWDGGGNFSRVHNWVNDAAASINITASRADAEDDNTATGIGACLTKNNETKPTATFSPATTRVYDLGTAALQWRTAYLSTSIIAQSATATAATTVAFTDATTPRTITIPDATGTVDLINAAQTISAAKTHTASIWLAEGAAVASAADCNIWGVADGNTVHITGTITISDWGTAPQAGATMYVIFDEAVPLTYSATTNKLNTNGENYTTQAGDRAIIYAETTSEYVVTIIPVNTNPYTLAGAAVALAATGTSNSSVASTAFVQQEKGDTVKIRGTHLFGIEAQPQNSTYYIGENGLVGSGVQTGSTTEANLLWWPVVPVTIRDLYISANALPAAGQTATVTLMKNGVATALTAQITDTGGVKSDTTNAITGGPGDYFSFRSVLSATSGVLSLSCSVRFTDPGSGYGISLIPFSYLSDTTSTSVGGLCLAALVGGEPVSFPVVHENCFMETCFEQGVTGGTVCAGIYKGVWTGTRIASIKQSTPYLMGAVSTDVSGVSPPFLGLVSGSAYFLHNTADGAAARRRGSWKLAQKTAGLSNQIKPLYFTSRTQAQATTRYMAGHGCIGHATEATKQFPITAGVLKNFILMNEGDGVDAQTWTANVRINGVQVLQLVLTESGTATGQVATNTASSLTVMAGDKLSVELVSSATTATKSVQFACDHLTA